MASPDVGQRGVFLAGGADFSSMQNAVGGMLGTLGSFAGKLGVAACARSGASTTWIRNHYKSYGTGFATSARPDTTCRS